jgi:hypothetical protein
MQPWTKIESYSKRKQGTWHKSIFKESTRGKRRLHSADWCVCRSLASSTTHVSHNKLQQYTFLTISCYQDFAINKASANPSVLQTSGLPGTQRVVAAILPCVKQPYTEADSSSAAQEIPRLIKDQSSISTLPWLPRRTYICITRIQTLFP